MRTLESVELIPGCFVGDGHPVFVVAEVGQNHNGRLSLAHRVIEQLAAGPRPNAVKFCKRHIPSDLSSDVFQRPYATRNSFGATYGAHRSALELSIVQHAQLQRIASANHLTYFSTACDKASVDELLSLDVPCFKVASRDLTNLPLLEYIAATGKPVILSCGMDLLPEIADALDTIRKYHNRVVLLHCTSAYPTAYEDVNLRAMQTLRREFDVLVGLSDHTPDGVVAIAAAARGAVLIEKHVTLDRAMRGSDHRCSLCVREFNRLVSDLRKLQLALGDGLKRVPLGARAAKDKLGRSLVAARSIPRGTPVTEAMICLKTAGSGVPWHQRHLIVGKVALRDLPADLPLAASDVE